MRKKTYMAMRARHHAYLERQRLEDIARAATHEAGHVLAHGLLGAGVEYATTERKVVIHDGQEMLSTGFTQPKPRPLTRETLEVEAVCCMAGPAAEDKRLSEHERSGAQGDVDSLLNYAIDVGLTKDQAVELAGRAYRSACNLVDANRDKLDAIALELMTKGRIEAARIEAILNATR